MLENISLGVCFSVFSFYYFITRLSSFKKGKINTKNAKEIPLDLDWMYPYMLLKTLKWCAHFSSALLTLQRQYNDSYYLLTTQLCQYVDEALEKTY